MDMKIINGSSISHSVNVALALPTYYMAAGKLLKLLKSPWQPIYVRRHASMRSLTAPSSKCVWQLEDNAQSSFDHQHT